MTVLFPGTVAGYLPYRIVHPSGISGPSEWSWAQFASAVLLGAGVIILLRCIWAFARHGSGTLAPFDEPLRLVVRDLYRYVRNPMYVGVVLILLGESLFFWSGRLVLYTSLLFAAFNVFVIGYEEPRLRSKYGAEYERYCGQVGRWMPSLRRAS